MSKISKVKNIWYVPTSDIRLSDLKKGGGQSTMTRQHGGSLEQNKNLNNFIAPVKKVRIVQDVQEWRAAIAEAEDPILPYRFRMQIAYMDTILDSHIRSCIERRENMTLLRKFQVVKGEKELTDWTKYLEKTWFRTFMKYALGAKWYGYTLISMGDIVDADFVNLVMIPRTHISPDRLMVSAIPKAPSGEKFLEEPYNQSHIWIATPDEHGLAACGYGMLYELTLLAIALRNNLNYNVEYAEVFAMPFRQLKTDKLDKENQDRLQTALEEMGSLGYMITGLDDEITFHDTAKGGGFKAYGDLEKRLEAKVSKIVLGHADALDSTPGKLGGGQGDSSPQAQSLSDIQQADGEFIMDIVNNKLFPFLRTNGINIPDKARFQFVNDAEEQESIMWRNEENIKIAQYISTLKAAGLGIDTKWIEENMQIKLEKTEEPVEETPAPTSPKKTQIKNKIVNDYDESDIPMHPNCQCDIIDGEWVLGESDSGPCDECEAAAELYNLEREAGNLENAASIFSKHKQVI